MLTLNLFKLRPCSYPLETAPALQAVMPVVLETPCAVKLQCWVAGSVALQRYMGALEHSTAPKGVLRQT